MTKEENYDLSKIRLDELLKLIEQHDDLHDSIDFLLDSHEGTILIEYIESLKKKVEELEEKE
jgi:hypothetical protein